LRNARAELPRARKLPRRRNATRTTRARRARRVRVRTRRRARSSRRTLRARASARVCRLARRAPSRGRTRSLMGGTNHYLGKVETRLPKQKYKLTILPAGRVIDVDPARLPYSRDGNKGSILEIALGHDVEIDHACGGVCACSTCHVIVREGLESMQE